MLHSYNNRNQQPCSSPPRNLKEFRLTMVFLLRSSLVLILFSTSLLVTTNAQWKSYPRQRNTETLWAPNMPATREGRGPNPGFAESSSNLPTVAPRGNLPQATKNKESSHKRVGVQQKGTAKSEPTTSRRQSRQRPSQQMPTQQARSKVPRSNPLPPPNRSSHRSGNAYSLPPQPKNYGQQQSKNSRQSYNGYPTQGKIVIQQHQAARGPPPMAKSIPGWSDYPPPKDSQAMSSNRIPHHYKQQQIQVPLNPQRGMKWAQLPQHQMLLQGQKSNQKVTTAPPPATTSSASTATITKAIDIHYREPRPVSQHPGHLLDSWPNSNAHHHLAPVGKLDPTGKPPISYSSSTPFPDYKIRFSNNSFQLVPSSTTKRSVLSIPAFEQSSSSLSQTQKEKILQMTNTLTKLSPKKPIHVFMKLEGIAATEHGADVGEVIKKYAGSSKVPFFNGTIPMNHIPTVFLAPEDMTPPEGYGKIPIPTLKSKSNNDGGNGKYRGSGHTPPPEFSFGSPNATPKPAPSPYSITYLPQQYSTTSPKPMWSDWGTPSTTLSPPKQKTHVPTPGVSMVPPMQPLYDSTSRSSHAFQHVDVQPTARSSQDYAHTVDTSPRNPFIASATVAAPAGYTKVLLPPGASGGQLSPAIAQKLAANPSTQTLNTLTNEQKLKIISLLKKGQTQVYGPDNSRKPVVHQQVQQQQLPQQIQIVEQQQQQRVPQVTQQHERQKLPSQEKILNGVKYTTGYKVIQAPASIDANSPDPYSFLKGVLPPGAIVESISPLKGGTGGDFDSLSSASISVPNAAGNILEAKLKSNSIQFQNPQQNPQSPTLHHNQPQQTQRPQNPFTQFQQSNQNPFQQQRLPAPQQAQKVVVNPGIQISLPKNNDGKILDNTELNQIIGAIVKSENSGSRNQGSGTPPPQLPRQPLLQGQGQNWNAQQPLAQQWNQNQIGQNGIQNWQQQLQTNSQIPSAPQKPGFVQRPAIQASPSQQSQFNSAQQGHGQQQQFNSAQQGHGQQQQFNSAQQGQLQQFNSAQQGQQQQYFPPQQQQHQHNLAQQQQQQQPNLAQQQRPAHQINQSPNHVLPQIQQFQQQLQLQNQFVHIPQLNQFQAAPNTNTINQKIGTQNQFPSTNQQQNQQRQQFPQNVAQGSQQINHYQHPNQQNQLFHQQGKFQQNQYFPQQNQQMYQQHQNQQFAQQNQQFPQQNQQFSQNQPLTQQSQFPHQNPFPPLLPQFRQPQVVLPSRPGPILGTPQTIVFPQNNLKQPSLPQNLVYPTAQQREGVLLPGEGQGSQNGVVFSQDQINQQPQPEVVPAGPPQGNQQETGQNNPLPVLIPAPPPSTTKPPPPPPPTRPPLPPQPSRPPPQPSRPPPPPQQKEQRRPPTGKPRNPLKTALSFLGIQSTPKPELVMGKPVQKFHPSQRPEHPQGPSPPPQNNKITDDEDDSDSSESSQHEVVVSPHQQQQNIAGDENQKPSIVIAGDGNNIPEINRIINSLNKQHGGGERDDDDDDSGSNESGFSGNQSPRPPLQHPVQHPNIQQGQLPQPPQIQHIPQHHQYPQQFSPTFTGSTPQTPHQYPSPSPFPGQQFSHHGPSVTPNPFVTHVGSTGRPTSPMHAYSPSPSPFAFMSSTPTYLNPTARPMLISPTGTPGTYLVTNQSPGPLLLQTNPSAAPKPVITFPSPSPTTPTSVSTQQYIVQSPSGPPQIITMGANVSPAALHLAAVQSVIRQNLGLNLGPTGTPIIINPSASSNGNTASFLNGGTVAGVTPSGGTIILSAKTLPSTTIVEQVPVKAENNENNKDVLESEEQSKKITSTEKKYASKEELMKLLQPSPASTSKEYHSKHAGKKDFSGEKQKYHYDEREDDRELSRHQEDPDNDRVIEKVRTEEKIIWDGPTPSKIRTEERTISRPSNKKHSRESVENNKSEERFHSEHTRNKNNEETNDDSDFFKNFGSKYSPDKKEDDTGEKQVTDSLDSSATSSPSSFANLLASKMKYDILKQKLYPQQHFLGGPTDEQQQPIFQFPGDQQDPQHDIVRLPDGRLTFFPSSTQAPAQQSITSTIETPVESSDNIEHQPSSTTEPSHQHHTSPAVDTNGRFKIRPGDLSKFEDMTPLFSITPSSFDPAMREHMRQNQHHQENDQRLAYVIPSSTGVPEEIILNSSSNPGSPSSSIESSTPAYPYVSGGSANPMNYEHSSGSGSSTTKIPYHSSTSQSSEEKLMFFPSSTSSSNSFSYSEAVGPGNEAHMTDERLLFFPSSTPAPAIEVHQDLMGEGERNNNYHEGGDYVHEPEASLQWEQVSQSPKINKIPEVPSKEKEQNLNDTTDAPVSTTTTAPSTSSTTSSSTTTTEHTTTTEASKSNESTTEQSGEDKPITWRPTKTPSSKPGAEEPEPAVYTSSAERIAASNVGANSLHAMMAGLPHQQQHKWQDTAHITNKDVGASVLYAVANGAGVPVHHGPPGLVPVTQYHHHTMLVTPGLNSREYISVTPSYYKPTEKSYYDHWYGTSSLSKNNEDRDNYETVQLIEEPSSTTVRSDRDRPRYRSKYRIPPGTSLSGDGNSKKLIPIYVQKNGIRRHRYRTRPAMTTSTTPLPPIDEELPSSEYDDEGLPLSKDEGYRASNSYYDELDGDGDEPVRRKKPQKLVRPEDIDDNHPAFAPSTSYRQKQRLPEKKVRVPEAYLDERRTLSPRRRQRPFTTEPTTTTTVKPRPYYDDDTSEETQEEDYKPKEVVTPAPLPRRRKVQKFADGSDELYDDYDLKPMFQVDYKTKKRVKPSTPATTTTTTESTTTTTTPSTTTTTTTTTTPAPTTTTELTMKKRRKGMRRRTTTTTSTTPEYETSSSEEISEELQQQTQNSTFESQKSSPQSTESKVPDQVAESSQMEIGTGGVIDQTNTNQIENITSQIINTTGGEFYPENIGQSQGNQGQVYQDMVDLSSLEQQQTYDPNEGGQILQSQQQPANNGQQTAQQQNNDQPPATIMIHGFQPILTQILPHRPQTIALQTQQNMAGMDQQQQIPQSQFNNRILQNGQFSNNGFQQQQYFQNNLLNPMQQQQAMEQQQFMNNQGFYQQMPMMNNMYQGQQPMMGNMPQYMNNGFQQQGNYYPNMMNQNGQLVQMQQPMPMQGQQNFVQPPQGLQQENPIVERANDTNENETIVPTITISSSVSQSVSEGAGHVNDKSNEAEVAQADKEQLPLSKEQLATVSKEQEASQEMEPEHDQQKQAELDTSEQPKPEHLSHDMFELSGEGAGNSEEEDEREHTAKFVSSEVRDPFRKSSLIRGGNTEGGHISNGSLSKKLVGMSLLSNSNSKLKDNISPFLSDGKSIVKKSGIADEEEVITTTTTTTTTLKPITTRKPLAFIKTTEAPLVTTQVSSTIAPTTVATTLKPTNPSNTTVQDEEDYNISDLKQLLKKLSSRLSYSDELYDYYDPASAELLRNRKKPTTTTTVKPKSKAGKNKNKSNSKDKKKSKPSPSNSKKNLPKSTKPIPTTKKPIPKKPSPTFPATKPISKVTVPPPTKFTPKVTTTTKKPFVTVKKFTPRTTMKPTTKKVVPIPTQKTIIPTTTPRPTFKTRKPIVYNIPSIQSLVKETTQAIVETSSTSTTTPIPISVSTTTIGTKKPIGISEKPLWVRRRILKSNGTIISEDKYSPPSFNPAVKLSELSSNGTRRSKIRVIRRRRPGGLGQPYSTSASEQMSSEYSNNISNNNNYGGESAPPASANAQLPLENLFVADNNLVRRVGLVGDSSDLLGSGGSPAATSSIQQSSPTAPSSSTSSRRKLKLVRTGDTAQWTLTQQQNYNNNQVYNQYVDPATNEYSNSYNSNLNNNNYDSYNSANSNSDNNNYNPYSTNDYYYNNNNHQHQAYNPHQIPMIEPLALSATTTTTTPTIPPPLTGGVQPEPIVVVGSGSADAPPKKQIRMESSVAVETTVCVRGKCEVVTKN